MKILVADDDLISRTMLQDVLGDWGHEVVAAGTGEQAYWLLQQHDAPRLALMDWMMPVLDGIQVCRLLRQQKDLPYTYIILLTVRGGVHNLVEGLEAGADEYLTKPYDLSELRARLGTGQRILSLQDDLLSVRRQLGAQATRDEGTGLWNRRTLLDLIERELLMGKRLGRETGLLMADLDHLDQLNGRFGEQAGAAILREAAARFLAVLRPYDLVGRFAVGQFLVALPGCSLTCTVTVAEKLRYAVAVAPCHHSDTEIPATVSIGCTVASSARQFSLAELLEAAGEALVRAKQAGHNRVETVAQ
jgi:diguanylate cyclase (GGDEF)-like protein